MKDLKKTKNVKKTKTVKNAAPSKKRKTTKQKNNKQNKILITIISVFLILLIILLVIIFNSKNLTCTKTSKDGIVTSSDKVVFKLKGEKINNIKVTKKFLVDSKDNIDYISSVKTALNSIYKDLGVKYKIEEEKNSVILEVTYDKNKEYIIDNVFLVMEQDGISINLISEDNENSYGKINLSKKYTTDDLKTIFKKAKYTCDN